MGLKILFVILLIASSAQAAETKLNAEVDYESYYYFSKLSAPTRNQNQIVYLKPSLDIKFNKRSRMVFKPQVRSNLSTQTSEKFFLNPKEAYWEIKPTTNWRFRLGENVHSWGVMDAYSPLDVTNGRVMYNPLNPDKRGAGGVDIQYDAGAVQFQALYIPYQARTVLPATDSRWLPRSLLINTTPDLGVDKVYLPDQINYHFLGDQGVNKAVQNNFGFKLNSRRGNWDFSAVYFEGASLTPQIRSQVSADAISFTPLILRAHSDIGLIPLYYRQQVMGGNIVWAPSDLIIRLESSYTKSRLRDPIIPAWIWQNALGIEKPVAIGATTLTLVLQTYYAENKDPEDNQVSSANRLFDRTTVFGARWSYTEATNVLFSSLYNYRNKSSYFHLAYDTRILDNVKLTIAGDMLEGTPSTLLGTYSGNDRVSAQLSCYW